ncbi:putative basic helix-loop-helix leucine zipper transcription factor [Helianthus annuus]|uniref:Basic helix-loop-helix leucine zipper transcription factor n=1 Tax=Helianthus annuus TaxID=4232 RepID=A0A9K3P4K0_HELAN|nr:putative basic helix-loop-helix leucine zipper transcription factor [Helianthus annuus]
MAIFVLQMMSMGCSMAPMMFLGVQPHMPPMGMGMGMGTGMNHAMFPYPVIPPGQPLPNPAVVAATAAAHLSPAFPAPGFNMTPIPVPGPTPNLMNSLTLNSQNQPHVLGFADPFQQYHGPHQTQLPLPQAHDPTRPFCHYLFKLTSLFIYYYYLFFLQNRGMSPIAAKLSSSKDATNPDIITKPVE